MSTLMPSASMPRASARLPQRAHMPFVAQVAMLTWRALVVNFREPAVFVPPLVISAFTLLVYQAQLGGVAEMFLRGQSYLGFILPLSVVSAALSGSAVAGQTIVNDIGRGYFDKLILTPVNRWALLLSAMLAGAVLLALQTITIITLALVLGLQPVTGIPGLVTLIGFALLLGVGFSGLSVGIALLTGNAAATGGSVFLFFPLTFLTATFVPTEQLTGWIKIAAQLNPITYVLEATRAVLNVGWEVDVIGRGLLASSGMFILLFGFALYGLRARTRRR